MQIKIAICGRDTNTEKVLVNVVNDLGLKTDIDIFINDNDLYKEIESEDYDLIFIDIEPPIINGVEVGRYIRENLKCEDIQIVYISGDERYAMELFESHPLNFLIKPVDYDKIRKVIDRYLLISGIDKNIFSYKKGHRYNSVRMSDILFFESNGRKIIINMRTGTDEFYGMIDQIYEKLDKKEFLNIHKSFIVNCNYIKEIGYEYIVMFNGRKLPISKMRRKMIRNTYIENKKG